MFNGVATQSEQIPSSFQANSKSFQVPSKYKHKPTHNMATCKIPQNQPIYQALIEKANSYPSTEYFKANAYKKAAQNVADCDWDIAKNTCNIWRLCGSSTETFIINYLNTTKTPMAAATPTKTPITGGSRWVTPDTKGSGPFGYLADADETEDDDYLVTLIPTCRKITVQKLIDALQAAIKENPTVAAMEVVPDILDDGNNLGPYEVTIDSNVVFISSGERNPY